MPMAQKEEKRTRQKYFELCFTLLRTVVEWEWTFSCQLNTADRTEHHRPLESRLILSGICCLFSQKLHSTGLSLWISSSCLSLNITQLFTLAVPWGDSMYETALECSSPSQSWSIVGFNVSEVSEVDEGWTSFFVWSGSQFNLQFWLLRSSN